MTSSFDHNLRESSQLTWHKRSLPVQVSQSDPCLEVPQDVCNNTVPAETFFAGSQDVKVSSKIGIPIKQTLATCKEVTKKQLAGIYDKILVIDNISTAKVVVQLLTKKYMKFIHACHVEVC